MARAFRVIALVMALLVAAGSLATDAAADRREASGTIKLQSWSLAAGFGWQWGSGILRLNDGSLHPFTIHGLDALAVGLSRFEARGRVYNLRALEDFPGFYGGGEIGLGAIQSASAIRLENSNGVVIDLETDGRGYRLQLGPKAMTIELHE